MDYTKILKPIDDSSWELPTYYKDGMRVPGVIFANEALLPYIASDQCVEQVANVAHLPGIVGQSLAMPDIHWGYGFPIGGVAATDVKDGGVISPGGVGFDINCGVRLLRTDLTEVDVRPHMAELIETLFENVHTGTGPGGRIKLGQKEMTSVLERGAHWAVENDYGDPDDLEVTEEGGSMAGTDLRAVGQRPRSRGRNQLGTLGGGNHFLEVQAVQEIYDAGAAEAMCLTEVGQVTIMIHCGSRGLGHQVCTDHVRIVERSVSKYDYDLPDRQLASVPVESNEGRNYLGAMRASANFAWANRQCIAHFARESFENVLGRSWRDMGMWQVYDLSHNMAKLEEHDVDGDRRLLCVHRKGATRAFPAGHPDVPERYREIGQPVLIPGDMGRGSYIAVGGPRAMERSFGSSCHGAGRAESRTRAKKLLKGRDIRQELEDNGIIARAHGWASLAEEAVEAYKNVDDVVQTSDDAGLSTKVVRLRPLGVIKG